MTLAKIVKHLSQNWDKYPLTELVCSLENSSHLAPSNLPAKASIPWLTAEVFLRASHERLAPVIDERNSSSSSSLAPPLPCSPASFLRGLNADWIMLPVHFSGLELLDQSLNSRQVWRLTEKDANCEPTTNAIASLRNTSLFLSALCFLPPALCFLEANLPSAYINNKLGIIT